MRGEKYTTNEHPLRSKLTGIIQIVLSIMKIQIEADKAVVVVRSYLNGTVLSDKMWLCTTRCTVPGFIDTCDYVVELSFDHIVAIHVRSMSVHFLILSPSFLIQKFLFS